MYGTIRNGIHRATRKLDPVMPAAVHRPVEFSGVTCVGAVKCQACSLHAKGRYRVHLSAKLATIEIALYTVNQAVTVFSVSA